MDPDIIVHVRGTDNRLNLLAIEVKPTSRGAAELERDRNKLRGTYAATGTISPRSLRTSLKMKPVLTRWNESNFRRVLRISRSLTEGKLTWAERGAG